MSVKDKFDDIVKLLTAEKDCTLGKMMSSPGIKYKNKVFAFLWNEKMGFKLGKEYDIDRHNIHEWDHLSPFKTKPPLYAWYVVGNKDLEKWQELTDLALDYIKSEID